MYMVANLVYDMGILHTKLYTAYEPRTYSVLLRRQRTNVEIFVLACPLFDTYFNRTNIRIRMNGPNTKQTLSLVHIYTVNGRAGNHSPYQAVPYVVIQRCARPRSGN